MMKIVIASKNYSSWSLRAWLALEQTGAAYRETLISTADPDWHAQTRRVSPSGKVPLLKDDGLQVHDSLAIVEYLNERYPSAGLWPQDASVRAYARSVVAEMHSGFAALRSAWSLRAGLTAPCTRYHSARVLPTPFPMNWAFAAVVIDLIADRQSQKRLRVICFAAWWADDRISDQIVNAGMGKRARIANVVQGDRRRAVVENAEP